MAKTRNNRRSSRKNKYTQHKRVSRANKKKQIMKGGSAELKPVPFVPPGKGYVVGSSTNGLGGGYYYNLATPDIHAPNGTAKTSNDINVNGKPMYGGKKKTRSKVKKNKKTRNNKKHNMKYKKRHMRGGGLIPDDLVYLYRNAVSSLETTYNGLTGQESKPSINPDPMYQPDMTKKATLDSSALDINKMMNQSIQKVSSL